MALITKPNTFSAGAVIVASEHNDNFDTIYNLVNANIDNANINASAAIATSKVDWTSGDINISKSSTTTDILTVTGNSLTSGSLALFTSSGALTDAAVKIVSTGASSTGETLFIDTDATGNCESIFIDSEATTVTSGIINIDAVITTGTILDIDGGGAITTGTLARFYVNAAGNGDCSLVKIINNVLSPDMTEQ